MLAETCWAEQISRRPVSFCPGQPNTDTTIALLERLLAIARDQGKRVLLIFWDRASWHKSKKLYRWIRAHNQRAKQTIVRLLL